MARKEWGGGLKLEKSLVETKDEQEIKDYREVSPGA